MISAPVIESCQNSTGSQEAVECRHGPTDPPGISPQPSPQFMMDSDSYYISMEEEDKASGVMERQRQHTTTTTNTTTLLQQQIPYKTSSEEAQSSVNTSEEGEVDEIVGTKWSKWKECWDEIKSLLLELSEFNRKRNWKKKLLTVVIILSSILVFYDLIFRRDIQHWLTRFLEWMTVHPNGAVLAFILIFVISTRKYCWWMDLWMSGWINFNLRQHLTARAH